MKAAQPEWRTKTMIGGYLNGLIEENFKESC